MFKSGRAGGGRFKDVFPKELWKAQGTSGSVLEIYLLRSGDVPPHEAKSGLRGDPVAAREPQACGIGSRLLVFAALKTPDFHPCALGPLRRDGLRSGPVAPTALGIFSYAIPRLTPLG